MSFDEDLSVFFNDDEFADEVRVVSTGRKFYAIFDESYFDPQSGETDLETTAPRLTCQMSDTAGLIKKTKITVKLKKVLHTFTVLNVQPDGTGTAVVTLSNQSQ